MPNPNENVAAAAAVGESGQELDAATGREESTAETNHDPASEAPKERSRESYEKEIRSLREESSNYRRQRNELRADAEKWREQQEAEKSELQKAQERAEQLEAEKQQVILENKRLQLGAEYGLAAEDMELLGEARGEEGMQKLAEHLAAVRKAAAVEAVAPPSNTPYENLAPGSRVSGDGPAPSAFPDDWPV